MYVNLHLEYPGLVLGWRKCMLLSKIVFWGTGFYVFIAWQQNKIMVID